MSTSNQIFPSGTNRIGTLTNLPNGATYDILSTIFNSGYPQGQIEFGLGDTPRKITGIQKVAQTFMKILFTSLGSNVLYPDQGTNFQMMTINANITVSDTVFMSDIAAEIASAESQTMAAMNTVGSDPSSQLQGISILGIDTGNESVIIYLQLITVAGELAQVAVPFPQLDLPLNG
jgi:hypothetical protein